MLLPHQLCPPLGRCNSIHHEHGRWGWGEGSGKKRTGSKAEGSTSSLLPKFTFLGGFCYKVENEMLLDELLRLIRAFLWPLPQHPHPRARHPTSQRHCYTVISKGSPGPAWDTPLGIQSTSPPLCQSRNGLSPRVKFGGRN